MPRSFTPACAGLAMAVVLAGAFAPAARAQWSSDPAVNLGVCVEPGDQWSPAVVTDSDGGLIVFWIDERPAAPGLYAQRLDQLGFAQWDAGGMLVASNLASWAGWQGAVASDGAGGAIVAWVGASGGPSPAIFAQRLSHSGVALWGAGGVTVSTRPASANWSYGYSRVDIAPDEAGGVVIAWGDSTEHLAIQGLDADGQLAWPAEAIVGSSVFYDRPQVASDGAGGAIVGFRIGGTVLAQRVDATAAPRWGAGGVALSGPDGGYRPNLVSDGAGGAVAAWMGFFPEMPWVRLLAQRVDSLGAPQWLATGVQLDPGVVDQGDSLLADGAGGAYVVWHGGNGLRVQHLGATGSPLWDSAGVALGPWAHRATAVLAPAADGGVLTAWWTGDMWGGIQPVAQSLSASGAKRWGESGLLLSTAARSPFGLAITGDGSGTLFAAWLDGRNASFTGGDIYAQRVNAQGTLGVATAASPARVALAAGPVPSRRGEAVSLRVTLARDGRARVAVHDVSGRLVRLLEDGARAAGTHTVRWDGMGRGGHTVPPGLYLARLVSGADAATARIVVGD